MFPKFENFIKHDRILRRITKDLKKKIWNENRENKKIFVHHFVGYKNLHDYKRMFNTVYVVTSTI